MELVNQKLLTLGLVTMGVLVWNGGLPQSSPQVTAATSTTSFVCTDIDGKPTTVAKTKKGMVPIVVWNSEMFSESGFTPQVRCRQVSKRFQTFYRNGQLKYITAGTLNNLPVLCATKQANGSCTPKNILYTLKPTQDPLKVIQQLTLIRNRATSSALEESASRTTAKDRVGNSVDMTWLENNE